jgi:hypothetical protein
MSEIQGISPPSTSPSSAIPLPKPPPPPSLSTLRSWLPLYLKKTDTTIDRLSFLLSTPRGTDTLLLALGYSSLLTSTILSSISLARLHRAAQQIIERAIALPPNTTVLINLKTSSIPSSKLLILAKRLKALSLLISDFRIFARLWGLIGIYKWGRGVVQSPNEDVMLRWISYAQVCVNLCYQYLENGAYLSSKGVLGWSSERQGRAWVISSRFWMAHVVMDFVRLGRELAMRRSSRVGEKGEVVAQDESEWREKWRKEMVVNMAYAPLTLHWSLEKGLVGEFWVGLLGSVAGFTGLRVLWKNTSS